MFEIGFPAVRVAHGRIASSVVPVSASPLLHSVKGHVAEAAHHQQRQLGQADADDEQQRTAQEDERRPGEEQPRGGGGERVQHGGNRL